MVNRRLQQLVYVKTLAETIDYNVFVEYTCERALIFYENFLKKVWNTYIENSEKTKQDINVYYKNNFPFKKFIVMYL